MAGRTPRSRAIERDLDPAGPTANAYLSPSRTRAHAHAHARLGTHPPRDDREWGLVAGTTGGYTEIFAGRDNSHGRRP